MFQGIIYTSSRCDKGNLKIGNLDKLVCLLFIADFLDIELR